MVANEFSACCLAIMVDGRHQCDAVIANGYSPRIDVGLPENEEVFVMDGYLDSACCLLDDRSDSMALCNYPCDTTRVETSEGDWLAIGGAVDSVCFLIATMVVSTSNDRRDLLPYPTTISTTDGLR